jgi:hypothetical protein
MTHGSFNLFMAVMSNQEDVKILAGKPDGFTVNFRHQRARRV